ncbi:MAG: hypothetical protein IRZ27_04575 [Acidothermus cellulolyticus]|nr:hypothetical protein [Acidothermus cellulolyticus]
MHRPPGDIARPFGTLAGMSGWDQSTGDALAHDPASLPSQLDDLAVRLSRLSSLALARRISPGSDLSVAAAARRIAARVAALVQGVEHGDAPQPPVWRSLPPAADTAVGFQLRVLAHDLAVALPNAAECIWTPEGRRPVRAVIAEISREATELAGHVQRG